VNPPTEQLGDVKVVNRLDGTPDRVILRGEALRRWLEENRPEGADQQIATMTPEQLAEEGIPATVALRARLVEAVQRHAQTYPWTDESRSWAIRVRERREALAILEAKGQ
jgi:hypothetical protein